MSTRKRVNNDGSVNSTDGNLITALAAANGGAGTLITDSAYNADADIDRNGLIDDTDATFFAAIPASAPLNGAGSGVISDPDAPHGPDNVLGYCGYVFNREHRAYTVRYRTYFPELGRWAQRDPAGYVNGIDLYEYVAGNPFGILDPYGMYRSQPLSIETLTPGIIRGITEGTFTLADLVNTGMSAAAALALINAVKEQEAVRQWATKQIQRIADAINRECPQGPRNEDWCKKLKRALKSAESSVKTLHKELTFIKIYWINIHEIPTTMTTSRCSKTQRIPLGDERSLMDEPITCARKYVPLNNQSQDFKNLFRKLNN